MLAITLHSLWACGIAGGPRCLYTAAAAGAVRVAAPAPRPLALTVGSELTDMLIFKARQSKGAIRRLNPLH